MNVRFALPAAAVAGLCWSSAARASTVSFSAPIPITMTTALDVSGGYSTYTIQDAGAGGGHVTSSSGITTTVNAGGGPTNQGAGGFGGSTGNPGLDHALMGFTYDANPVTITLSGLTPGDNYSVALFGVDDRSCCGGRTIYFSAGAADADGTMGAANAFAENSNSYVLATFNATSGSEIFNSNGTMGYENLNAVIVRDTTSGSVVAATDFGAGNQTAPEPASLSLLSVASLTLLARRRRCRV